MSLHKYSYVKIYEDKGAEPIGVPTDEDNRLSIQTIKNLYPDAIGLGYISPNGAMRILRTDQEYFIPPDSGFEDHAFFLVFPKKTCKSSSVMPKDENTELTTKHLNLWNEFAKEKDLRIEEKNLRIAESYKIGRLEMELLQANNELLRMIQKMSPRGSIEFFEERAYALTLSQINLARGDKWKLYYRNDYKQFKREMQSIFPALVSMTQTQQEDFVSDLVKESYANTSCFHHSFDLREGVFICQSDYSPDQQSFLKIVCNLLPCNYKIT